MASLVAGIEAGFEPIAGYVLREKIGSGGYGEVWLADAPGGLQKAVKFVYGSIDERAGGELRALQRIRAVHHPFILSLERIEVTDGKLIVVTELADGTLLDRYREFQQRGLAGIPRDRLIEYLRDTADALDFLCQKHELQHLDVKPANLLLVADRIKVADFGLIKDIQNKSMSLMSGMTPTYASPEMFDGRPGRFSDQYSLAIVYQEMLTGSLPFHGRTTAQLATEHLQKAPDLESLPIGDRLVIAKALAKKPSRRFASCREFIDELRKVDIVTPQASPRSVAATTRHSTRRTPRVVESESVSKTSPHTTSWSTVDIRPASHDIKNLPPLSIATNIEGGLADAWFIGLGGTGIETILTMRNLLRKLGMNLEEQTGLSWSLLDIDKNALREASDPSRKGCVSFDETIALPLNSANQSRDRDNPRYTALSRRWLFNIPRSGLTDGVRPIAMLAWLDNADSVYHALRDRLEEIVSRRTSQSKPLRIYFVGSAHGATGSVLLVEAAFLVQQLLREAGLTALAQAVVMVASHNDGVSTELATACGMSCMREIDHYYRTGGLHPGIPGLANDPLSSPPWDQVYAVYGGQLDRPNDWHSAVAQMADFLGIDACTLIGEALDEARNQTLRLAYEDSECEWQPWLRTLATRRLDLATELHPQLIAKQLLFQQLQELSGSLKLALKPTLTGVDSNHASESRLSQPQTDMLVSDLFREQKWSAQTWVRQCMDFLVPATPIPPERGTISKPSGFGTQPNADRVNPFAEFGLDLLASSLGIPIEYSQMRAREMLNQAFESLQSWMDREAFVMIVNKTRLSDILQSVDRRFLAQSESLHAVAERLAAQRDKILTILHQSDQKRVLDEQAASEQRELNQQIRSLIFQVAIHKAAGAMLLRLRSFFKELADEKIEQVKLASDASTKAVELLARDLGIAIDMEGLAQEERLSLPIGWRKIRQAVLKSNDESLQNFVFPTSNESFSLESWLETTLEAATRIAHEKAVVEELLPEDFDLAASIESTEKAGANSFDRDAVTTQLQDFNTELLGDGSAVRKILMLPTDRLDDDSVGKLQGILNGSGSMIELEGLDAPLLYIDGERMALSSMINRLWSPNAERNRLAERLHSRVDVDWISDDSN
jgi:serine/threonine protein kinase